MWFARSNLVSRASLIFFSLLAPITSPIFSGIPERDSLHVRMLMSGEEPYHTGVARRASLVVCNVYLKMEGITITLAPNASYRAEDLVIHRKYKGECDENLVKWTRIDNTDGPRDDKDADERTSKEYLVWMRRLEMEACCPHLLSLERFKSAPTVAQAASAIQQPKRSGLPLEAQGDESLHEMADDIHNLVARAQRIMRKPGHKPGGVGGKMLSNILSILSAYAKIGALANIFRESGAMDILLSLLSSQDLDVRRSASDMLQSLAEYDSGSRAYVLLQLTRGESGPAGPRSTQQSRQMLLDLFADTASGDESELLLSGITLPPVCVCVFVG